MLIYETCLDWYLSRIIVDRYWSTVLLYFFWIGSNCYTGSCNVCNRRSSKIGFVFSNQNLMVSKGTAKVSRKIKICEVAWKIVIDIRKKILRALTHEPTTDVRKIGRPSSSILFLPHIYVGRCVALSRFHFSPTKYRSPTIGTLFRATFFLRYRDVLCLACVQDNLSIESCRNNYTCKACPQSEKAKRGKLSFRL